MGEGEAVFRMYCVREELKKNLSGIILGNTMWKRRQLFILGIYLW